MTIAVGLATGQIITLPEDATVGTPEGEITARYLYRQWDAEDLSGVYHMPTMMTLDREAENEWEQDETVDCPMMLKVRAVWIVFVGSQVE